MNLFNDPLSAGEHLKLGESCEADGLNREALSHYEAAVRLNSDNAGAWMKLGELNFVEGDFKRSEMAYRRALKLSPDDPAAVNNLAMAYLAQNRRLHDAERLAVDVLPRSGELKPCVLDTLANIYLRVKRFDDAESALNEAEASAAAAANDAVRDQLFKTRQSLAAARVR